MNNDLSILSSRELGKKLDDVRIAGDAVIKRLTTLMKEHTRLVKKRRVRPFELIGIKKELDDFKLASALLNEYNKTLIDERNRRIEVVETVIEETPQEESILEKLEKYYGHDYSFNQIEEGYGIARKCAPHKKLQAVKEFKDLTKAGLKESKQFMDIAFDYLNEK